VPNQHKVELVQGLKDTLAGASTVILTNPTGLSVKNMSVLRSRLKEADAQFKVVKNTLFKLAADGTPVADLVADLEGPTAAAVTQGDPVAAAKALAGFIKEFKLLSFKGGFVEGRVISAAQVQELSTIPPRQQLLAMVVGGLQSPIAGLVGTLQSTLASLVMTLQAVADKQAA
jgi:large subunit ribosomal protein L10